MDINIWLHTLIISFYVILAALLCITGIVFAFYITLYISWFYPEKMYYISNKSKLKISTKKKVYLIISNILTIFFAGHGSIVLLLVLADTSLIDAVLIDLVVLTPIVIIDNIVCLIMFSKDNMKKVKNLIETKIEEEIHSTINNNKRTKAYIHYKDIAILLNDSSGLLDKIDVEDMLYQSILNKYYDKYFEICYNIIIVDYEKLSFFNKLMYSKYEVNQTINCICLNDKIENDMNDILEA